MASTVTVSGATTFSIHVSGTMDTGSLPVTVSAVATPAGGGDPVTLGSAEGVLGAFTLPPTAVAQGPYNVKVNWAGADSRTVTI